MKSHIILLFIVFSTFALNPVRAVQYAITDLGTLGGSMSVAYGINDYGQVVGGAYNNKNKYHAFLYSGNGPMQDLGTLGGISSCASYINNKGQVVGYATTSWDDTRAFVCNGVDPMKDLGAGSAYGISDDGQVAISAYTSDRYVHAYRTLPNQPLNQATDDLGILGGGYSYATGINNIGQVAGRATVSNDDSHSHIFLYTGNGPMLDFGTLGGTYSEAYSINDLGQIVGCSTTNGSEAHAFRSAANQPLTVNDDLGTLGGNYSRATGINNNGDVVGASTTSSDAQHAFLFNDGGVMLDLNEMIDSSSGWVLNEARDINNLGQIAGTGTIGGEGHAFLLTPVPEPSTLVLLCVGIFSLLAYAWRKQQS